MFADAQAVKAYFLAGRGILTVRSTKTGNHYTFKFSKPARTDGPMVLFVSVLVGRETYRYVGHVGVAGPSWVASRNAPACTATAATAFAFLIGCLRKNVLHTDMEVSHQGRCG